MKDVELPEAMQRVMSMQAEAIREKRARIVKGEDANLKVISKLPAGFESDGWQSRCPGTPALQMISEVGAENNTLLCS